MAVLICVASVSCSLPAAVISRTARPSCEYPEPVSPARRPAPPTALTQSGGTAVAGGRVMLPATKSVIGDAPRGSVRQIGRNRVERTGEVLPSSRAYTISLNSSSIGKESASALRMAVAGLEAMPLDLPDPPLWNDFRLVEAWRMGGA